MLSANVFRHFLLCVLLVVMEICDITQLVKLVNGKDWVGFILRVIQCSGRDVQREIIITDKRYLCSVGAGDGIDLGKLKI